MSTLLDSILDLVKGEAGELIGKAVGVAPDKAADVSEAGVSSLLSGLNAKLDTDGVRSIEELVRAHGRDGLVEDVPAYLKSGKFGDGGLAADGLLGTSGGAIAGALAKQLGLGGGMGRKLLVMLAPLVFSFLKKGGLKGGGLSSLIKGALPAILGGKFGGLLGGLGLLGAGAAGAGAVGGSAPAAAAAQVEKAVDAPAEKVAEVRQEITEKRGGIGKWVAGLLAIALGLLILGLTQCGDDDANPVATPSTQTTDGAKALVDVAVDNEDGNYSTFVGLVESSGLTADLAGDGPFTVFAPNNEAFDAAALDTSDVAAVKQALLGHVVSGKLTSDQLTEGQKLTTLAGTEIEVALGPPITVGGAEVTEPDMDASNGVLHGIAGVIAGKVPTGKGLAQGIAGDYGPWRFEAWRDKVFNNLKPAVAARAETLDDFEGGFGIRINP